MIQPRYQDDGCTQFGGERFQCADGLIRILFRSCFIGGNGLQIIYHDKPQLAGCVLQMNTDIADILDGNESTLFGKTELHDLFEVIKGQGREVRNASNPGKTI